MYGREAILIVNHQNDTQGVEEVNLDGTIKYINDLITDVKSRCGLVISAQDWYENKEDISFGNGERPVFSSEKFNFTNKLDSKNIDFTVITPDRVNSAYSAWSIGENKIVKDILDEQSIKILHIVGLSLEEGVYATTVNAAGTGKYDVYVHLQGVMSFTSTPRNIAVASMGMHSAGAKVVS